MTPRIIYLIRRAEIEVSTRMDKALEPYNVSPIQYTLLYFIDLTEGNPSSAQLSRRFSMTPQSMGELVQALQAKKLVKKDVDPTHRRILRVSVTPKGKKLIKSCSIALDKMEEDLLKAFDASEENTFRTLLGKILAGSRETASAPSST